MKTDLQKLLDDCRKSKTVAQKQLFDHFAMQMFVVCRRYVQTDQVAEEVMMNGFLKFFQSLDRFVYANDAALAGWIKKIMVNESLMHLRANNSFLQISLESFGDEPVDEAIISAISAEEIFRLITKLPVGYRTVFNLAVIEKMPHQEIAKLLGISEGTSKSQLSKAKNVLQQLLIKSDADYACRKTK
jgi:RNA polymerase sigma-70 factor (ECF subfamily)